MPDPASRARKRAKPEPTPAKPARAAPAKGKVAKPAKAKTKAAPIAAPPESGPWSLPLPAYPLQGVAFGLPYPSAVFHCDLPPTTPEQRTRLLQRFETLFDGATGIHPLAPLVDPAHGVTRDDTTAWFVALAGRLQQLANLPVYVAPRVIGRSPQGLSIQVPALSRGIEPTVNLLKLVCAAFALEDDARVKALQAPAQAAFGALKASALTTSNTPRLVKAAVEHGIAFQELAGSLVLYGIGRNSVLMDSTFTHECSNVGARLAKYKQLTTAFLRRAGLPAPANAIANSEEQALEIARKIGFPVVVKPADKDGGIAVQADLRSEDEVRWAYQGARKVTNSVLVEKFYEGRDYRIIVFRGRAIWAKERQPAGVTGDGTASIAELVERVNADPRRGSDVYAALKKIVLDDDAEALLVRDGLSADSVPKKGEFVRLRRRANVSAGGVPIAVTDRMHPDNARLAERATEVVGLDLAGVDLIIPDIARSWREVPAAICEINAQPELGGDAEHLYPQVLRALVRANGHVPTIAILGGPEADEVSAAVTRALAARGLCVGSHDRSGVHVGGETLLSGDHQVLRAGRMLTMDRGVEAIVLGALDLGMLRQGLPVQQIDALLLTGDTPPGPGFANGKGGRLVGELLRMVVPHCRSVVALASGEEFDPALLAAVRQTVKVGRTIPRSQRATFVEGIAKVSAAAVRKARG